MATKVVFIKTTGAGTWTAPPDFNPLNNSIVGIGGGAGGTVNATTGGGGGEWARSVNVALAANALAYYNVGLGGTTGSLNGGDTWFNKDANSPPASAASGVRANGGQQANLTGDPAYSPGGTGGVGTTKNPGGRGTCGTYTGGGGGAGSELGPGLDGGNGGPACGGGGAAGGGSVGGNASGAIGGLGGNNANGTDGGAPATAGAGRDGFPGSGGTVAGSPAVNDADLEWAGDYLAPVVRTDTNRGARIASIPSWVPSTAWQWTQIPGTRWNDVMKPTSAGGVAPSQAGDPVGSSYDAQWAFGAITYSPKNHEMWLFGGGHDDTTINALSKWTLGTNSPFVSMVCEPTAVADRLADWAQGRDHWLARQYHTETNPKPKSAHAYTNNHYFDDIDEFILFGEAGVDEPGGANCGYYGVAGFPRGGSQWRAEGYWPSTDLTVGTYAMQNQVVFKSYDGTALYYARKYTSLFKYTTSGVKTTIGSGLGAGIAAYAMRGAAESATRALLGGGYDHNGGTGWRLWFVDLTTGVATAVTVSGAAYPTDFAGYQYNSMVWVPSLGRYFALITSLTGTYIGSNINAVRIFEFEPTGSSTVTATEKTITGTGPIRFDLMGPMHYDPTFGVLLLGSSPSETLFSLKVS